MGTRYLTCVVMDGEYKVAQYGQWDGYPTGAGHDIVDFIKAADMNFFRGRLKEVSFLDEKTLESVSKIYESDPDYREAHPELSRDTGAGILQLIVLGKAKRLLNRIEFAGDSLFCEWAYVLDMDNEILEVYEGFNKHKLDESERFYELEIDSNSEYCQVVKVAEYTFKEIKENPDFDDAVMRELEERAYE